MSYVEFPLYVVGNRGADDGYGYGQQPSSARASVASSEGYGPHSSRSTRDNAFGGGNPPLAFSVCLSVCWLYTPAWPVCLSVCLPMSVCIPQTGIQAGTHQDYQTDRETSNVCCLFGGLDVCLPVCPSVTAQPVSEICIQHLNCSSFAFSTCSTVLP